MAFNSGTAPSCYTIMQEPMPDEKSLEYAIQATASAWMPFKQVHNVESGDVDFDSFGMAPWDAGGMHDDRCRLREALQTMMLQWLMRLLCRPVIVHGLNRDTTENTENGLDTIRMMTTDSPRLTVTPGECYASDVITQIRRDLRHTHDNSATVNCNAVELNDLIFRQLNLPPENDSAGCDGTYGSPKLDSAAADSGAVGLDDLTFRWLSFPPEEFAAGWDAAAAACGAVKQNDLIFRRTNSPPDEFSAGRNGDYIWRDLWTRPSVCNRPVTGSHGFGSSQRLGRCCLWLAALPVRGKGSAELPQCYLLTPLVSRASYELDVPVHSLLYRHFLGNVFANRSNYDLVIILDSPWSRHPVWPDGGNVFAELDMSLIHVYGCVVSFLPLIRQFSELRHSSD